MAGSLSVNGVGPLRGPNSARLSYMVSNAKGIKFDPFLERNLMPGKEVRYFSKFLIFDRSAIVRLQDADKGKREKLFQAMFIMVRGIDNRAIGNEKPTDVLNTYRTRLPAIINAHPAVGLEVVNVYILIEGRPVMVPVIYAPKTFRVRSSGKHMIVYASDQWGMAEVQWPHPIKTAKLKYQHGINEEAGRELEKICRKFQSRILLRNPKDTMKFVYVDEIDQAKNRMEVQVDKNIINSVVLGLGFESEVIIEAIGPDADKAIVEVERFVESPLEQFI